MPEHTFMVSSKRRTARRDGLPKTGAYRQQVRKDRDEDRNEKWAQGCLECQWKSGGSKEQNWHLKNNIHAVKHKHETLHFYCSFKRPKNEDRKGDIKES